MNDIFGALKLNLYSGSICDLDYWKPQKASVCISNVIGHDWEGVRVCVSLHSNFHNLLLFLSLTTIYALIIYIAHIFFISVIN